MPLTARNPNVQHQKRSLRTLNSSRPVIVAPLARFYGYLGDHCSRREPSERQGEQSDTGHNTQLLLPLRTSSKFVAKGVLATFGPETELANRSLPPGGRVLPCLNAPSTLP